MSNLRRSKLKGWYEYYREICPVCNKSGGCMINEEGDTVVCIRVDSKTQFSKKFPSWIHHLTDKRKNAPKDEVSSAFIQGNEKANAEQLNEVYLKFLDCTWLIDSHYGHLTSESRRMSEAEINTRQYKSFPDKPWLTVREMENTTHSSNFVGVPGFFQNQFGWSISGQSGILIPYRNERNQITGFQTRTDIVPNVVVVDPGTLNGLQARVIEQPNLVQVMVEGEIIEECELEKGIGKMVTYGSDYGTVTLKQSQKYFWLSSANKENGTGAGNPLPVHVAVPTNQLKQWKSGELHRTNSVWITEGALKADIAAEHIQKVYDPEELVSVGSTVIAVPGVNTWRAAMPVLKEMGVQNVNIAFDIDAMRNPDVALHLKDLALELKKEGYSVNVAMWNEDDGKGIDDLFLSRKFCKLNPLFKKSVV